jgi:hypothetical protein
MDTLQKLRQQPGDPLLHRIERLCGIEHAIPFGSLSGAL